MPVLSRLLSALLLAAAFTSTAHGALPVSAARAELQAIEQLAEHSSRQALDRLDTVRGSFGKDLPYDVRQRLLRLEVWLREDMGQLDEAYAVQQKARQLAEANHDAATAALASLGEVRMLLNKTRNDEAMAAMERILAQVPDNAPATVRVAMEQAQGDVFNARGWFDKALGAYLRALRLAQNQADGRIQRAVLYERTANVYSNADNPAKALETTRLALAESGMPIQVRASLQFTGGIALLRTGRDSEAIAAFEQALASSERAGMLALAANIRGNIADYYLRRHDYVRAELESRKAMSASSKVKDQNIVLMAQANLGFALMGQGRIAEGLPHIDDVIAQLRKAKAGADLEAMLDEKGRMLERAGQYQHALAVVREQQALHQTSARAARDRAIATLQEEFDANRRSQQIALLQHENRLKDAELGSRRTAQLATSFAAILTVLAGIVVFLLYRRAARSNARLKELNTQLEFRSTHDTLTGLHNRGALTNRMNGRTEDGRQDRRAGAREGVDCFILMDIDHFKSINDRCGHGAGDAVLVEVARRLNAAVRETDMVVRWGGEEFMVYAPGTDAGSIAAVAGRILDAVGATPVDTGNCAIPVSVTAGVFPLPPGVSVIDWQAAVRLADWALYQGKAQGRNQARIVTGLRAPAQAVLTALDSDSTGKAIAALLDVACVPGPRQDGSRPAQAHARTVDALVPGGASLGFAAGH